MRPKNDDLAPARFKVSQAARLDRRALRFPERISVGEIAVVAEQVGDDLAGVGGKVEQRDTGRDRLSAEQPLL